MTQTLLGKINASLQFNTLLFASTLLKQGHSKGSGKSRTNVRNIWELESARFAGGPTQGECQRRPWDARPGLLQNTDSLKETRKAWEKEADFEKIGKHKINYFFLITFGIHKIKVIGDVQIHTLEIRSNF